MAQKTKLPKQVVPYMTGAAVGLNFQTLPGLKFNMYAAYTGCMICGALYQSVLDRLVYNLEREPSSVLTSCLPANRIQAEKMRKKWALKHSKTHSEKEHLALRASGQFCTPEAALVLAPLGVISLAGDEEVTQAMYEAPRKPKDDVEGT